jgi:hypothetical protein
MVVSVVLFKRKKIVRIHKTHGHQGATVDAPCGAETLQITTQTVDGGTSFCSSARENRFPLQLVQPRTCRYRYIYYTMVKDME